MNKQQLASKIWESANKMRSKIEANEYKDYILGFIFYKYLSDTEVKWLKANDFSDEDIKALNEEDTETVEYIQKNIGYFIEYKNLYSTWISPETDFDVSDVTDAISAFNRNISQTHKKVFEKIFHTLETGLSKLGDTSGARTKAIGGLLDLISDIPMDGKQDYDVLGFIYEYLISQFAANAGKKAGEFYTPHEVSFLMSEIVANHLKDKQEIKIYDPTSGSGSLLINIGKSVAKYMNDMGNIKYYAQELKENTYNLTRMNLVMRGIKPDNIVTRNGDTLEEDWPFFDENDPVNSYDPLYVDAVVSNPPYSQPWEPNNKEHDPRYSRFGLAPKGKADYAFLLHDLFHVKPDGIMTIVLPHGVLFRGGDEGKIRQNLIESNNIDAIIGLPANIFFGTGIPTIVMVLKQRRDNDDVLIVDASKGFVKEGKNNKLRASDIKKIVDTVIQRKNTPKYSKVVTRAEIRENGYNLNIPRYVDSSEKAESFDIYASMFGGIPKAEIEELNNYFDNFSALKANLFTTSETPYVALNVEDVKTAIKKHNDIVNFKDTYNTAFADFGDYLKTQLIDNMLILDIQNTKATISDNIFARTKLVPLVDKYEAYQVFDDNWTQVATDLEIIGSEGFSACTVVDPNMVIKKKDGKETEVQDGYIGRILPFELVQNNLLSEDLTALKTKETRLLEIPSELEEILENLTEDEKETDILNEDKTAFISKEITKKIKELKGDKTKESIDFLAKLKNIEKLFAEEKTLKAEVKKQTAQLHLKTKNTIENLDDDMVYTLLCKKWIETLTSSLAKLPNNIVDTLVSKTDVLAQKYQTTYSDIAKDIKETEKSLASMLDDLTGDDFDMKGLSEFKALLLGEDDE